MFKTIGQFLTLLKDYVWALCIAGTILIFIYGLYIKISETIPTKVYALETRVAAYDDKLDVLETRTLIVNKDLVNLQATLKEVKEQIASNQKETRESLREIEKDVKYILKNI